MTKRPIYNRLFYIINKWHIKKYLLHWKILNTHNINANRIIQFFICRHYLIYLIPLPNAHLHIFIFRHFFFQTHHHTSPIVLCFVSFLFLFLFFFLIKLEDSVKLYSFMRVFIFQLEQYLHFFSRISCSHSCRMNMGQLENVMIES